MLVLHIGYAFVPVGFLLLGVSALSTSVPATTGIACLDRRRHRLDDSRRHDARIARPHRPTSASGTRDTNHLCGRLRGCGDKNCCHLQRLHHTCGVRGSGLDRRRLRACVRTAVSCEKAEFGETSLILSQCPLWVISRHLQAKRHVRFTPNSGHWFDGMPRRTLMGADSYKSVSG